MRVAMIGTRGVPARYGGFETAIEEIGRRLVGRGHEVVVYCRGAEDPSQRTHLGMELVHLPAARRKTLETLSHTALSVAHLVGTGGADAAIVFNAANAPFVPVLRARGIPVAVHVDGLEWKRAKWKGAGRRYYRAVEAMSVRLADALIADASGIAAYYADEFGADTELLAYGAPVQDEPGSARVEELGLLPQQFHLVVARFEPENHVLEIVEGYRRSDAELPLVVVGSAPYADEYTDTDRERGRGRPQDPAARRCLGPRAARPAVRQLPHLPARPLGRRNEPVAAAGHGRRGRRAGLRRGLQPRGAGRSRASTSARSTTCPSWCARPS